MFCQSCGSNLGELANAQVCPYCQTPVAQQVQPQPQAQYAEPQQPGYYPSQPQQPGNYPQQPQQSGYYPQQPPPQVVNHVHVNAAPGYGYQPTVYTSHKNKVVALILCIFFGYFGAHRFYVGKTGSAIVYLFTFGGLGIGWLIDFVLILTGSFRDRAGYPLR